MKNLAFMWVSTVTALIQGLTCLINRWFIVFSRLEIAASATRNYRASISKTPNNAVPQSTGRRTTLAATCPDNSHVGLMAILYNNIGKGPLSHAILYWYAHFFWHTAVILSFSSRFSSGKDLARVSMPAALNEPVNLLQRLCEELEYSELLDTANNTPDPYQRMVRHARTMTKRLCFRLETCLSVRDVKQE